jgi:hypothetical protein
MANSIYNIIVLNTIINCLLTIACIIILGIGKDVNMNLVIVGSIFAIHLTIMTILFVLYRHEYKDQHDEFGAIVRMSCNIFSCITCIVILINLLYNLISTLILLLSLELLFDSIIICAFSATGINKIYTKH